MMSKTRDSYYPRKDLALDLHAIEYIVDQYLPYSNLPGYSHDERLIQSYHDVVGNLISLSQPLTL